MQVTEHVHTIKIPFKLRISQGKTLNRFVYAYLIYGKQICLIDCGVSSSNDLIFDYIRETGRAPEEITMAVITHAHPDHIGGALGVQKSVGCKIASHIDDVHWIEDVELQYRERPIPSFHSIVEGSVKVDLVLKDGNIIGMGEGRTLKVIHTAGHSRGHISLLYEEDGALFSGDCIPLPGTMPIYEDVLSSLRSLKKLREIKGLEVLFSSWDEPRHGYQIHDILEEGIEYFQDVHRVVLKEKAAYPSSDIMVLAAHVLKNLGLPEIALNPISLKSIEAHLRVIDYQDLLEL